MDLPWDRPVEEWHAYTSRLEEVLRGLSRHPVIFVNYDGTLYAFKEMAKSAAAREYDLLRLIEDLCLPAVTPVGYALARTGRGEASVLITRYLDHSLPYRSLFMRSSLGNYRKHLLDAMAGLIVQLHLAGIFWGDCSLSNVLFRRDAGTLQAYLVDAETAEGHEPHLAPTLRHHDLVIMEENVTGELGDLAASGLLPVDVPLRDTGAYIRQRYQRLWEEITREEMITPEERYRIHERIRALNELGFSVGEISLETTENGERMRLQAVITDRNFHRNQLYGLTGLQAEERQARKMMNEIQELKATLTQSNNRSTPLSVAAYHWLKRIYQPVMEKVILLVDQQTAPTELYCQVLEHKWFLSEKARRDVGHQAAVEDYLRSFYQQDGS